MRTIAVALAVSILTVPTLEKPPEPARQPSDQAKQTETAIHPKEDDRGALHSPLVISPLVVETVAKKSDKESAEEEKERAQHASTDWWTIRIGWATIAILLLQTFVFGLQARRLRQTIGAMERIAKEQRIDVENSIAIAKESAGAAKKTAETTEEAMVSNQRPWLMISDIQHKAPIHRCAGSLTFLFDVKNVGHSPATNIVTRAQEMPVRDPTESDIIEAISHLMPNKLSSGRTLVPTDSDNYEESCVSKAESTPNRLDLAYVLVCVFYSFTFKASKCTGYYAGGYRVFEKPTEGERTRADLEVEFERYYSHAD